MSEPGPSPDPKSQGLSFLLPVQVTLRLGRLPSPPVTRTLDADADRAATGPTSPDLVEKVPVIFPDLNGRTGYRSDFLSFEVPPPKLTEAGNKVASNLEDGSPLLHYHKFSLVMHKRRRMALYTAANVDWRTDRRKIDGKKPSRKRLNGFQGNEKEDWVIDPRIPLAHQLPDDFYKNDRQAFDRGHLVRRDDVAWGETFEDMQKANGDTFHTTNCSPQVGGFNRSNLGAFNWGDLEDLVERESSAENVCVFSGPIFREDDPEFEGLLKRRIEVTVQIPQSYWKIIIADHDGSPQAYGFILDQELAEVDFLREFAVPGSWRQHMKSILEIEDRMNGLVSLEHLRPWDQKD